MNVFGMGRTNSREKIMKIAIVAAGGVGGYLGLRLADAGHEVAFLARGAHLTAIREGGLRLNSALGDLHLSAPIATEDPADIGEVDLVIFAVKLWDTENAAMTCKPLLGSSTQAITFQNGVDSIPVLSELLGPERVVGGVAYISSAIAEPGVIQHNGESAKFIVGGENDGPISELVRACAARGIDLTHTSDIDRLVWEKFTFFAGASGVTSAARAPIGQVVQNPELRETLQRAMEEVVALGRERGVDLSGEVIENQMKFGESLPYETQTSVMRDLLAGRRLEVPWLSGAVHRIGLELGIPTPVNSTLFSVLGPHVDGI